MRLSTVALILCGLAGLAGADELIPSKLNQIVDGNTFKVYYQNRIVQARLIGVNLVGLKRLRNKTMTDGEYDRAMRMAKEARVFAQIQLSPGRAIWLEFDKDTKDQDGRKLVYLWLDGDRNEMMNEVLLRKGYGTLNDLPPNVRYKERLWKAQEEAKLLGKGLWQK